MAVQLTKSQIDRLGNRLRTGNFIDADLRLLDTYRRSFASAYETVIRQIVSELNLDPTGRPSKSTTSIIDKLQRESIRLSQIQDIAGCRVIVPDLPAQDDAVAALLNIFGEVMIVDRRENPSHGYRAVHLIVGIEDKFVEVQIRTVLQHLWAEVSEKLSDVLDKNIKYGGGSPDVKANLALSSLSIKLNEFYETRPRRYTKARAEFGPEVVTDADLERVEKYKKRADSRKEELIERLKAWIAKIRTD